MNAYAGLLLVLLFSLTLFIPQLYSNSFRAQVHREDNMVWCQFNLDSTDPTAGFDMKVSVSHELCDLTSFVGSNKCGIIRGSNCKETLEGCNLLLGECKEGENNDTHHCYLFSTSFSGTICCELQESRDCINVSLQSSTTFSTKTEIQTSSELPPRYNASPTISRSEPPLPQTATDTNAFRILLTIMLGSVLLLFATNIIWCTCYYSNKCRKFGANVRKYFLKLIAIFGFHKHDKTQHQDNHNSITVTSSNRSDLDMPNAMGIPVQCVVICDNFYVGGGSVHNNTADSKEKRINSTVMKLNLQEVSSMSPCILSPWSELPIYAYQSFAMTAHSGHLVLIGGWDPDNERSTSEVARLESGAWIKDSYPHLQIARYAATAVCYNERIVVIAGITGMCDSGRSQNQQDSTTSVEKLNRTSSVEVLHLNANTWQWFVAEQSLPLARSSMKSALNGDILYLMGGIDQVDAKKDHPCKVVYQVNIKELTESIVADQNESTVTLWDTIQDTTLEHSTPLVYQNSLFAIGGRDHKESREPSSAIHVYQSENKVWERVGELSTARYLSTCFTLPDRYHNTLGHIIVAGGEVEDKCIGEVEILFVRKPHSVA